MNDSQSGSGTWSVSLSDIAIISTDGTVLPIYNRETSVPLGAPWGSGSSAASGGVQHVSGVGLNSDETTNYYHGDHLGSQRLMTNTNGYPTWSATFLPFGEEWNQQITTNHYKFTGKERDSESGLDNFGARYDSSQYGRFMSPDPGNAGADPYNPQSWNGYSYVQNNPLNLIDPTGLCISVLDDTPEDLCMDSNNSDVARAYPTATCRGLLCYISALLGWLGSGSGSGSGDTMKDFFWNPLFGGGNAGGSSSQSNNSTRTPTPNNGKQLDQNSCAARLANGVQSSTGVTTSDPQFTETHGAHNNYSFTPNGDPSTFQNVLNQNAPWRLPFGLDTGHRYGLINSTHILDPAVQGDPYTGHTDLFNGHSVLAPLHVLVDFGIGHIPGVNLDFGCHK